MISRQFFCSLEYTPEHAIETISSRSLCFTHTPRTHSTRVTGGTAMVKHPWDFHRLMPSGHTGSHLTTHSVLSLNQSNGNNKLRRKTRWSKLHSCYMSLHGYNMQDGNNESWSDWFGPIHANTERRRFPGSQVEEINRGHPAEVRA